MSCVKLGTKALLDKPALARHLNKITKWLGRPIDWSTCSNSPDRRATRSHTRSRLASSATSNRLRGRARRLAELQERVRWVALADLGVCLLVQTLASGEIPPQQFVATYSTRIASWVCDVEDAL